MMKKLALTLAAAVILAGAARPASAQAYQIETKDGSANLKVGFLLQPQAEFLEAPDAQKELHTGTNLFLRRMRIMVGGKLSDHWTFFFETDSPNVGKANPDVVANPTGAKDTGTIYVQDAFATYNHGDGFKVDTGMLLPGLGHNHLQGAISLLPVDYGLYTFVENAPLGLRVGRDYGASLRGYPFKKQLEYRLGVFGGLRGSGARNPLRVVGRLAYWHGETDMGYFYVGTYQAQRKVLNIGGSFDWQKDRSTADGGTGTSYKTYGADLFWEQPTKEKEQGITFQVNYMHMDGDKFVPAIVKQDIVLVEAGYHLGKARFTPFVQYARRDPKPATGTGLLQQNWNGGLAYWMKGHNRNVKASVGQQKTEGAADRLQALVQLQVLAW